MRPEVRAAVVGRLVAEDVAVTLGPQYWHGAVVVPAVAAVLPRGPLGAPRSFKVRAPLQEEGQGRWRERERQENEEKTRGGTVTVRSHDFTVNVVWLLSTVREQNPQSVSWQQSPFVWTISSVLTRKRQKLFT